MRRVWACQAFRWTTGRALPAYVLQKGVRGRAEEQQRTLQLALASRPRWIVTPPTAKVQMTTGFRQS